MRVVISVVLGLALAGGGSSGSAAADKGKAGASQGKPLAARLDRRHAGRAAPAVRFELRDGTAASVADFRGRPVLVNLWATWCLPCIIELPALDALAGAHKGLAVLPVSQDLGGWRAVDKFWGDAKFATLKPRLDKAGDYAQAVGAAGLPVSILYDAQGREVWRIAGSVDWSSAEVVAALNPAAGR